LDLLIQNKDVKELSAEDVDKATGLDSPAIEKILNEYLEDGATDVSLIQKGGVQGSFPTLQNNFMEAEVNDRYKKLQELEKWLGNFMNIVSATNVQAQKVTDKYRDYVKKLTKISKRYEDMKKASEKLLSEEKTAEVERNKAAGLGVFAMNLQMQLKHTLDHKDQALRNVQHHQGQIKQAQAIIDNAHNEINSMFNDISNLDVEGGSKYSQHMTITLTTPANDQSAGSRNDSQHTTITLTTPANDQSAFLTRDENKKDEMIQKKEEEKKGIETGSFNLHGSSTMHEVVDNTTGIHTHTMLDHSSMVEVKEDPH